MRFQDYSMNFKSDKVSNFISEQVPDFVNIIGGNFSSFLEAYYRFLESKIIEITVYSEDNLSADDEIGSIVASFHGLMCSDNTTYLGEGTDTVPMLEVHAYRKYQYEIDTTSSFIIGELVVEKTVDDEVTGCTGIVSAWDVNNKLLTITSPEGFFSQNNVLVGQDSDISATILYTYHELITPSRIVGSILGSIDIDNETALISIPRKKLIVNHISGSIQRLLQNGEFGELYSDGFLQEIAGTNKQLPVIAEFVEVETPIYALNNMFNFGDIDYAFNNKLFLGDDYYSLMAKEIMMNWPQTFATASEEITKAIIGRNIKDFYKSKGTLDSIKFIFRILYGEDVEVFIPSEKIMITNNGRWDTTYTIVVEKDINDFILSAENTRINSSTNPLHYANIELVEDLGTNVRLTVSDIFGDFLSGTTITGILTTGDIFECEIVTSLSGVESYVSSTGLLNGGVQSPPPVGYVSWDDVTNPSIGLEYADMDVPDRLQDSYYYQLFSYVVRSRLLESEYDNIREVLRNLVHPAGLKLFLEPI